jgi:hypothetical protein
MNDIPDIHRYIDRKYLKNFVESHHTDDVIKLLYPDKNSIENLTGFVEMVGVSHLHSAKLITTAWDRVHRTIIAYNTTYDTLTSHTNLLPIYVLDEHERTLLESLRFNIISAIAEFFVIIEIVVPISYQYYSEDSYREHVEHLTHAYASTKKGQDSTEYACVNALIDANMCGAINIVYYEYAKEVCYFLGNLCVNVEVSLDEFRIAVCGILGCYETAALTAKTKAEIKEGYVKSEDMNLAMELFDSQPEAKEMIRKYLKLSKENRQKINDLVVAIMNTF